MTFHRFDPCDDANAPSVKLTNNKVIRLSRPGELDSTQKTWDRIADRFLLHVQNRNDARVVATKLYKDKIEFAERDIRTVVKSFVQKMEQASKSLDYHEALHNHVWNHTQQKLRDGLTIVPVENFRMKVFNTRNPAVKMLLMYHIKVKKVPSVVICRSTKAQAELSYIVIRGSQTDLINTVRDISRVNQRNGFKCVRKVTKLMPTEATLG